MGRVSPVIAAHNEGELYWGAEDLDFALRCRLMGHPILHDPGAVVGHRFQRAFGRYEVPAEHVLANQLRLAYKNYTPSVFAAFVEGFRRRHAGRPATPGFAPPPDQPEGPFTRAWIAFEGRRASAEEPSDSDALCLSIVLGFEGGS